MDDSTIVELYWRRDEHAIYQTDKSYGSYCHSIAYHILGNREDADESVNDTYLRAWNTIPPTRPTRLSVFLGRITHNLSIDRRRVANAKKRGAGEYELALEELEFCLSSDMDMDQSLIASELTACIDEFLQAIPAPRRRVFIRRYWYFCSVPAIAQQYGYSVAKTKSMLYRTRNRLHTYLIERGVLIET